MDGRASEGNPSVSFADSIPQFAMVVPLRSQVRLRLSLAHWAYFALLRAQRARFVRPPLGKGSLLARRKPRRRTPPDVLLQWQTAFPHRRFYLFADSSVPDGTLPAQIEHCTMEGWLTDSVASAKLLGLSVRPLPFHCTTLAMSCPAPRLAASVLGLLYSNSCCERTFAVLSQPPEH